MENNRILIVDDEIELIEIITFDLEAAGFLVESANNGLEALELLKNKVFNVVISDIRMPQLSGLELLESIRTHDLSTVFIFITAFFDITLEEAYDRGADCLLSKPFDRRALVENIRQLVIPASKRWTQSKIINIKKTLTEQFKNYQHAHDKSELSFGRGGLFVFNEQDSFAVGELINFDIHFTENNYKEIAGQGIVRWTRSKTDKNLKPGLGIEITFLENTQIIQSMGLDKIKSYIPKT